MTANDNKDINIEVTDKPSADQNDKAVEAIKKFFSDNDNKDGVESFLRLAQEDERFITNLTFTGNDENGFIDALSNLYDNLDDINAINKFIKCVNDSMEHKGNIDYTDYSPIAETLIMEEEDQLNDASKKIRNLVNDIYGEKNNTCAI